mmetsp:Transcript_114394/g.277805  ORF Transcript_114394/g.277805 Transcript_114394/m.277805 type:complete len:201 (-) Transcript_114394:259-861(-)
MEDAGALEPLVEVAAHLAVVAGPHLVARADVVRPPEDADDAREAQRGRQAAHEVRDGRLGPEHGAQPGEVRRRRQQVDHERHGRVGLGRQHGAGGHQPDGAHHEEGLDPPPHALPIAEIRQVKQHQNGGAGDQEPRADGALLHQRVDDGDAVPRRREQHAEEQRREGAKENEPRETAQVRPEGLLRQVRGHRVDALHLPR